MTISLKAARANSNLSQREVVEQLAERFDIEVTRQKLSSYERQPSVIPITIAKALTTIYDVNLEDIFFGA